VLGKVSSKTQHSDSEFDLNCLASRRRSLPELATIGFVDERALRLGRLTHLEQCATVPLTQSLPSGSFLLCIAMHTAM